MRILAVCENGQVRSVALTYLIKTLYGNKHEAIAVGIVRISAATREMLFTWADKIVILDKSVPFNSDDYEPVPGKIYLRNKVVSLSTGEDIWHDAKDQELLHKLMKQLHTLNL